MPRPVLGAKNSTPLTSRRWGKTSSLRATLTAACCNLALHCKPGPFEGGFAIVAVNLKRGASAGRRSGGSDTPGRRATSTGSLESARGGSAVRPARPPSSPSAPLTLAQTMGRDELRGRTSKSRCSCCPKPMAPVPPLPEPLPARPLPRRLDWWLLPPLLPGSTRPFAPMKPAPWPLPPISARVFFCGQGSTFSAAAPLGPPLHLRSRSSRCQGSRRTSPSSRLSFGAPSTLACRSLEMASTLARRSSSVVVPATACFASSSCLAAMPRTSLPCCARPSSTPRMALSMPSTCLSRRCTVCSTPSRSQRNAQRRSFCTPRPWRRIARQRLVRSTSFWTSERLELSCCTMRWVWSTS
mmetsp:Transcript_107886/g.300846  ORF Transcript_107886/g.300846 Transcript_107886/m.300846 type:complete len:355 (+) Transcript_107886:56-1120(+)